MNPAIIAAIMASTGFWSLILYLVQRHDRRRDAQESDILGRIERTEQRVQRLDDAMSLIEKAVVAQMHDTIYGICTAILSEFADGRRTYVDVDEMHNLTVLYNAYRALGGNGTCEVLYNKVQALPLKQTNKP